jgi:hypothetical protein
VFEAAVRSLAGTGPGVATSVGAALSLAVYVLAVRMLNPVARETAAYCAGLLSPARFAVFLRGEIDKSPRT